MAGARIIFPDFREEQSDSRYPFADSATLRDRTGAREIPRDAFIDAVVHTIGAGRKAYISRITVDNNLITITVSNTENTVTAAATYNPLSPPQNGHVALLDQLGRPAGLLILTQNALALFGGWGVGAYVFNATATEFVATVVIPAKENCVRAITNNADQFYTGDVWLIGGNGVVVRAVDAQTVRVDIMGEPLFKRILCDTEEAPFEPGNTLRTINGCGPDEFGNFTLTVTNTAQVADPVLRISPSGDALTISAVGTGIL